MTKHYLQTINIQAIITYGRVSMTSAFQTPGPYIPPNGLSGRNMESWVMHLSAGNSLNHRQSTASEGKVHKKKKLSSANHVFSFLFFSSF